MSGLIAVYVCGAASALVLAAIAVLAPRRFLVRLGAVAAAALLLVSGYFSLADLLSRPKPVRLAWAERNIEEATLLGSSLDEGKAIYVWLKLPGQDEPRAYSLPWDMAKAEALQQASRKASGKEGTGVVRARRPFGPQSEPDDASEQPMFYAPAQPAPPPKAPEIGD
ncbi:MAG: hypothetical protein AB7P52_18325 [Alphaproteobacteria bacterium]